MSSLLKLFAIGLCIENLLFQSVIGQTCKFQWENGTELDIDKFGVNLLKIKDIAEPGKLLLSLRTTYVESITNVSTDTISKELYILPTLEKKILALNLTDHFVDYEKNEFASSISVSVIFKCTTGTKKVEFIQPIEDTNNHWPVFQKTPYIYKLTMPFPKGISLTNIAPISARDIDISNTNITFHLDPTDPNVSAFSISWLSIDPGDRKLHNASLVTKTAINFFENVTFILYATDTGNPQNTANTSVTIQVDRENSVLRFEKSLYIADLTNLKPEDANGKIITFNEGVIRLGGGVDNKVAYKIQDNLTDYGEIFEVINSVDYSTVQIRLKDPPEKFFLESSVLLSLTAEKTPVKESTVLYISLSDSKNGVTTSSNCDNMEYVVTIIVLGILLIAATAGLVVIVIKNRRNVRSSSIGEPAMNGIQVVVPEMKEVTRNGGVSPSGSFRKSVAFSDTVGDEIKIARL